MDAELVLWHVLLAFAAVVAAGLMAQSVSQFRPTDRLTRGELSEAIAALGGSFAAGADPGRPVKVRELDAALVRLLGLQKRAKELRAVLAGQALSPTSVLASVVLGASFCGLGYRALRWRA